MSFNSIIFVLAFMPVAVFGYYCLALSSLHRLRLPFLIVMSLIFYGRAQLGYVPLLLGSMIVNYGVAFLIAKNADQAGAKKTWLTLGVVANAGALIGLKYLSTVSG